MLNIPSVNRPIDQRLEMDFLEGHVEPEIQVDLQKIHTPKTFILPQLKPELESEPILYRVNIPQKKDTISLETQLLDIDRELSELSSIMMERPKIIKLLRHTSPEFNRSPTLSAVGHSTQKVVNPISQKRKENKKMLSYKTPLPKTIRIHYKTPRQNRRKSQKKKTRKYTKRELNPIQNQNKQLVSNFFRNLTK